MTASLQISATTHWSARPARMWMVEDGGPARLEIGSTLKQTRQRLGLEIRQVEEQTKIRIKYLRALENEEWDVLPAPAYVRGFLRAYADLLELDGEVLADEYRRQVEDAGARPAQPVGNVLAEPPRARAANVRFRGPPRGALLMAAGAAVIVILIVVVALTSGSDGSEAEPPLPADSASASGEPGAAEIRLAIVAESALEVCALDAEQRPLISSRLLSPGTRENLGKSSAFTLDLGAGEVRLIVDGGETRLSPDEPATYEITASGVQALPHSGPGCP